MRAPLAPDFPLEIEYAAVFTARNGATTISPRAWPDGISEAERHVLDSMHGFMRQGYGGPLDQLAAHLGAG